MNGKEKDRRYIGFGLACLTNQKTCGVSFIYTRL
jgi:hypothetical protein